MSTESPERQDPEAVQHHRLEESRRRHFARAAVIGVVAGLLAVAFQMALRFAERLRVEWISAAREFGIGPTIGLAVVLVAVIALVAQLTQRICPEAAGSGIPHLKALLLGIGTLRPIRLIATKFVGAVIGIGAGLSLGREGPTIQMGAAAAAVVSRPLKVPPSSMARVLTCGAGAGLAAAFNAPLAGFVFVIEELRREISTRTYGSALIATLIADMVSRLLKGQDPIFAITKYPTLPMAALPVAAFVGVAAAGVGIVFSHGILGSKRFTDSPRSGPVWLRAVVVGVFVVLGILLFPEAVGGGHHTAETVLARSTDARGAWQWLLLLLGAKLFLTIASYSTGAPGGIFMPMLVIGAAMGALVGDVASSFLPNVVPYPAAYGVIGMAAIFSAVVRAPLTGIVLIVEMTGDYELTFPLSIACLVAYLLGERFGPEPIYEALLHLGRPTHTAAFPIAEPILRHCVVEPDSALDGATVRDVDWPSGCLLVDVRRAGKRLLPDGGLCLMSGDELTISILANDPPALKAIEDLSRA